MDVPITEATKPKRISKVAIDALFAIFTECSLPNHKSLPVEKQLSELDALMTMFGVNRGQARRQLVNWKLLHYEYQNGATIKITKEEIEQRLNVRLSIESSEVLGLVLKEMIYPQRTQRP